MNNQLLCLQPGISIIFINLFSSNKIIYLLFYINFSITKEQSPSWHLNSNQLRQMSFRKQMQMCDEIFLLRIIYIFYKINNFCFFYFNYLKLLLIKFIDLFIICYLKLQVDVWSLGILMLRFITHSFPFNPHDPHNIRQFEIRF